MTTAQPAACRASAAARTCPQCHRGGAMQRVSRADTVHRVCRYCGHRDEAGWAATGTGRTYVPAPRGFLRGHVVRRD